MYTEHQHGANGHRGRLDVATGPFESDDQKRQNEVDRQQHGKR